MSRTELDVDSMLANANWLRRLARSLASNQVEAEDLFQDTWLAVLRSPPDPGRPARPWLAEVARNLVRMGWRTTSRRPAKVTRELESVSDQAMAQDDLMATLQLQRRLATFVWELDEPYRTAITLRFYEGLSAASIARQLDVPAGTVRWRLSEGVRRLRACLDQAENTSPRRWRALALWTAGPSQASRWKPAPKPMMTATSAVVVAVGLAALVWMAGRPAARTVGEARLQGGSAQPAAVATDPAQPPGEKAARLARFVGGALPALVAAAQDGGYTKEEMVADCVWHGERTFECRQTALETMVHSQTRRRLEEGRPPMTADEEAQFRKKRLDEMLTFGTTTPEGRRQRCEESVDGALGKGLPYRLPRSKDTQWHACFDGGDCAAASQCVDSLLVSWEEERKR